MDSVRTLSLLSLRCVFRGLCTPRACCLVGSPFPGHLLALDQPAVSSRPQWHLSLCPVPGQLKLSTPTAGDMCAWRLAPRHPHLARPQGMRGTQEWSSLPSPKAPEPKLEDASTASTVHLPGEGGPFGLL